MIYKKTKPRKQINQSKNKRNIKSTNAAEVLRDIIVQYRQRDGQTNR